MSTIVTPMRSAMSPKPQQLLNGEVHNWYRTILGFSDHLVTDLLEALRIPRSGKVLDPFCGAGTTLVECKKHGIDAVGIDANPASCFAARVKVNWRLRSRSLLELLDQIEDQYPRYLRSRARWKADPTYIYLDHSGMITRGWISPEPLRKAIALKMIVKSLSTNAQYKNALMLCLIAEVINGIANIKFGPELYCVTPKQDAAVLAGFASRVKNMAADLDIVSRLDQGNAAVFQGDARYCDGRISKMYPGPYDGVICSPPYPAEHDYTRNSRLELAFLEKVYDMDSLRAIKRQMIRASTKAVYRDDCDGALVEDHPVIRSIVRNLRRKSSAKTHGFAGLYPKVVQEYFGGMKRHFRSVKSLLAPKARCAYVVGDQSSYLQVHIPTAEILSSIAEELGYTTVEITPWRKRWSTRTSKQLDEHILILEHSG